MDVVVIVYYAFYSVFTMPTISTIAVLLDCYFMRGKLKQQ